MGFGKIIMKNTSFILRIGYKLESDAKKLKKEFDKGCPTKDELKRLIVRKNKLSKTNVKLATAVIPIITTSTTLSTLSNTLNVAVKTLKYLPFPLPPFTPSAVTNIMADGLDVLSSKVREAKSDTSIIPNVMSRVTGLVNSINKELQSIDDLILNCVQEALEEERRENETKTLSGGRGLSKSQLDSLNENTQRNNLSDSEKSSLASELGLVLTESTETDPNSPQSKEDSEKVLQSLQPNSSNPLIYRGFKFIIENDPKNTLNLPARRIKAEKIDSEKPIILYNLEDQGYSYSATFEVLVSEAQFRVDQFLDT